MKGEPPRCGHHGLRRAGTLKVTAAAKDGSGVTGSMYITLIM
ncbi:hypothetical protein KNP414_05468 [Paenibacillus mucilaginosus KNP414]|uniref:Uncharacterized protein n=1 Tax=Paenibacillus mucilaginosus (strain KNP414) TaxID=1036673 RepID=F8FI89_PAEMK|nr:hypothetical protein KNP414_05468 [Paenibacillus mucilaginosus KNP414]